MTETVNQQKAEESNDQFWFKVFGILTVFWLIGSVPFFITWDNFGAGLAFLAFLAGVPGSLCWIVFGLFLKSKRMLILGSAMVITSVLGIAYGETLKAHVALAIHEGEFMSKIAEARNAPPDWKRVHERGGFCVDEVNGNLVVAFDLGGGMFGDFPSIVYDPARLMRHSSYGEPDDSLPFSGAYHSVYHLKGPWYSAFLFPE